MAMSAELVLNADCGPGCGCSMRSVLHCAAAVMPDCLPARTSTRRSTCILPSLKARSSCSRLATVGRENDDHLLPVHLALDRRAVLRHRDAEMSREEIERANLVVELHAHRLERRALGGPLARHLHLLDGATHARVE